MAGFNGRSFTFDWDSTTLVGVQTRGATMNNELVDVTTDDDNGWRTLLATPGVRNLDVSISGITSDEVLIADFFENTSKTLEATLPVSSGTAGTISGSYMLASMELNGETDGAYEFTVSFQSTGAVTYTASS